MKVRSPDGRPAWQLAKVMLSKVEPLPVPKAFGMHPPATTRSRFDTCFWIAMRPLYLASLAVLITAGSASAQQNPAWIDPPDKTEAAKVESTKTEAAKSEEPMAKPSDEAKPIGSAMRNQHQLPREEPERPEIRQAEHKKQRPDFTVPKPSPEPGIALSDSNPRSTEWAGTARRLTVEYLASISDSNAVTLASSSRFYGDRVRFHGRELSVGALIAEKRRFVRRWPERRYEPVGDGMRARCDTASASCTVRATVNFQAGNSARRARSQGLTELVLIVSFVNGRPVIVSESSRVLRRDTAAIGNRFLDKSEA